MQIQGEIYDLGIWNPCKQYKQSTLLINTEHFLNNTWFESGCKEVKKSGNEKQ